MPDLTHPLVIAAIVLAVLCVIGLVWWALARHSHTRDIEDAQTTVEPPSAIPDAVVEDEIPPVGQSLPDIDQSLSEETEVSVETPEAPTTRMQRLRGRLARSGSLGKAVLAVLSRGNLSEADWEEIEDTLLSADVGLAATDDIMERLRTEVKVRGDVSPAEAQQILRQELLAAVGK